MIEIENAVIGGGVIGLAIARELALRGREVMLFEAEKEVGTHTSSRNSEVIHAGIYYPTGSRKAVHCVRGRELLYQYCDQHQVQAKNYGKLIVANGADQEAKLEAILQQAIANDVTDVRKVDAAELKEMEPRLQATAALLSPSTGVVDSHAFMLSLQGDIERHGGFVLKNHWVQSGDVALGSNVLKIKTLDDEFEVSAGNVINCAGLYASVWLKCVNGFSSQHIPAAFFAKGNYFSLNGRSPFSRLIYPLPDQAGLGTHLTLDVNGKARFGPDVEWLSQEDQAELQERATVLSPVFNYAVEEKRKSKFLKAIELYYPDIRANDLTPDYSGVRPKLAGPGEAAADFMIQDESIHGVAGWINLFGIESPGLTSSLSLANEVADKVLQLVSN